LPFVEYAGPILKNDMDPSTAKLVLTQLLDYIEKLSKKLRADYIEIRHPPPFLSLLLPSLSFKALKRHITFRIDLTKEESKLWRDLDKKCRNSLRKAMKTGIKIKEVNSDGLEQYYDLYLDSQKRLGSPPHSFDFFCNVHDAFKPDGLLQMTLAMYDDKPIAGVMFFCFKDKLYWFGNVINRKYARLNPTNLEDFVYSSKNVELPNPSERKYVLLSRMWSMMPKALARRIGPRVIGGIGL